MEQFMIVGGQLIKFFILIALGIICAKFKVLDQSNLAGLSRLVIRVVLPIMIFTNTLTSATREGILESLLVLPFSVVLYIVLWALASIGNRVFHLSEDRRLIYKALGMFGNVGFMGIPLISELCPNSGMLYIALFTIVDQGLFWTLGASYCKPASAGKTGFNPASLKKLLSPALVGIVLSIILVLCGVRFPTVIESSLQTVANASMPLSLIYIGGMLYFSDIRRVLRCWELYAQIVFKMTLLPIALYAVLSLLNMPQELCATMAVICGLPAISSVAMLCNQNGSDGDYATSAVMLTTVACVITLPLVSLGMALIG
jgi:hypothetical protein